MPVYDPAPPEVEELLERAMRQWHPELVDVGVTVTAKLASPTDKQMEEHDEAGKPGHPVVVKWHGYAAVALIKVTKYDDRVDGLADARLVIDRLRWEDMNEKQHLALLDHELEHVVVQRTKDGAVKTDDIGRPKLKLKLHDEQLGVFKDVARRHGPNSIDYRELEDIHRRWEQDEFAWEGGLLQEAAVG